MSRRPPRKDHVEPEHVFRDATGYRRTFSILAAIVAIVGLLVFAGDFLLRLHQHPSLGERMFPTSDAPANSSSSTEFSPTVRSPAVPAAADFALTTSDDPASQPIPAGQTAQDGVSLTFDGLPMEGDLPALLALLNDHEVEATFFVDGPALLQQRDDLDEITANGHMIGMLLTEPDKNLMSFILGADILDNATQFMVTGETDKRTLLVRARTGTVTLEQDSDAPALPEALQEGYVHVVEGLSVPNVALDTKSFVPWLVEATNADAKNGDVLRFDLMADNASHVIYALPDILMTLTVEGYHFQAMRLPFSPDEAMPLSAVAPKQRDAAAFGFLQFMKYGLNTVFLWMMAIAATRALIFLVLALVRGRHTAFDPLFQPPVTIIVPAYNEETVIERCIRSLLKQEYEDIHIIVVDDGSTDQTAKVVQDAFADHPQVQLIMQENHGKWSASNYALAAVSTPYFVIADADSLFLPDTVAWLIQKFKDDSVGAVSGQVEVGNHENLLTSCQRIEYIVSQNVMRRAYETFEGILVVPGAVGAWRTEAVLKAHEFSGDSITEDADLTVAVHRAGYRVRFQEQARSVTEAPATVRAFLRQRLRWTFGMLQVAWKHRGAIGEGRTVGYISIIDSIVFGLVSSVVSPIVDLLLVTILLSGIVVLATGGDFSLTGFPLLVLLSYLALTFIDIVNTLVSMRFERRFDLKLLLLVPFLRFGYRQLLYISTLMAMWRAISGRMAGWDKLERSGADFAGSLRDDRQGVGTTPDNINGMITEGKNAGPDTPVEKMQS